MVDAVEVEVSVGVGVGVDFDAEVEKKGTSKSKSSLTILVRKLLDRGLSDEKAGLSERERVCVRA